jgi:hypothetical protein
MAITSKMYGNAPSKAFNGEIDWDSDTIKVSLHSSDYSPDQDADEYYDDVDNEIANGNGYTTGGATLASKTNTYTGATNITKLDAADVTWSAATLTCRYAVIYKDTGTPSTSPLLGYIDFGEDVGSVSGDFKITWDSTGIFTFTVS